MVWSYAKKSDQYISREELIDLSQSRGWTKIEEDIK